jgi:hypothetical protein
VLHLGTVTNGNALIQPVYVTVIRCQFGMSRANPEAPGLAMHGVHSKLKGQK